MSELKTKYITGDDFKEYFGIDLEIELKDDDNPSNKVNAFLLRIENRIDTFLNAIFYKNIETEYRKFSDYQKKHYKLALLEQAFYVLYNGDISADSGYTINEGVKISRKELLGLRVSPNAKDELILCGLWNRHIMSRSRGALDGWWMF